MKPMLNCVICSIIEGRIPSQIVYRDEWAVAFLELRPSAPGHTLLVPRRHAARVEDLSSVEVRGLFSALHRLLPAVTRAAGAEATTVGINNGPGSGQHIPHVHIHIIPRNIGDGGGIIQTIVRNLNRVPTDEIVKKIQVAISESSMSHREPSALQS